VEENLRLDESLVEAARNAGSHATGTEAVRCALEEYIARRRRRRIIELFGTVEYEESYDHKEERRRDAS
jgi:hypothetical protein